MLVYKDPRFSFVEFFNEDNGLLIRSNVYQNKINTNKDPFMRSFPELLDIGIMGHCHIANLQICKAAGVDCYQSALLYPRPNMSINNYKKIIDQCKGRVFQVALGGAGDPNKHENFEEILSLTRKNDIVPNLTTSGMFMSDNEISIIKDYCGAIAISFYTRLIKKRDKLVESNEKTIDIINKLKDKDDCIVNIHYILSKDTIEEAIFRLKNSLFPNKINAIIFILYKPVGQGKRELVLTFEEDQFKEFLNIINSTRFPYKIGFDTCHTPALLTLCNSISNKSLDACEGARFSMYIDSDLYAYPCSFDCVDKRFSEDLRIKSLDEIWWSDTFNQFRSRQLNNCRGCENRDVCLGGCPLDVEIDICGNKIN